MASLGQLSIQGQNITNNLSRNLNLDRAAQLQNEVANKQGQERLDQSAIQEDRLQSLADIDVAAYENKEQWNLEGQQLDTMAKGLLGKQYSTPEEFQTTLRSLELADNGVDAGDIQRAGLTFDNYQDRAKEITDLHTSQGLRRGYLQAPKAPNAVKWERQVIGNDVYQVNPLSGEKRLLGAAPVKGPSTVINNSTDKKQDKFAGRVGEDMAKQQQANRGNVAQNNRALESLEAMRESKDRSKGKGVLGFLQGTFSEPTAFILSVAESIGITGAEELGEKQLRDALTLSLARDDLAPGERPTDADIQQLINAAPNAGDSEYGYAVKLGSKIAANKYKNAKAIAENKIIDNLFDKGDLAHSAVDIELAKWREANPIDDFYEEELKDYLLPDGGYIPAPTSNNRRARSKIRGTIKFTGQEF